MEKKTAGKAQHRRHFLAIDMLRKLAPLVGAIVVAEPEWGEAVQLRFKNGKKVYARSATLDINPTGAAAIARDKGYARFFMKKMKYPIPQGGVFYSEEHRNAIGSDQGADAACAFAAELGFPVIVKPNSSAQGAGVFLAHSQDEVHKALRHIFKHDKVALVEEYLLGRDYRLLVADGKLMAAYERTPLSVVGDGASTILQLFEKKKKDLKESGRTITTSRNDPRMLSTLAGRGLTVRSVPESGTRIALLAGANLSSGGDVVDVTDMVHPDFKTISEQLSSDMGLRLCGVDLLITGSITDRAKKGKWHVLEVNSSPGLTHFASLGSVQKKRVEEIYLRILKAMSI